MSQTAMIENELKEFFDRAVETAKEIVKGEPHPTMIFIMPHRDLVAKKKVAEIVPIHVLNTENEDDLSKMRQYIQSVFHRCYPMGVAIITEATYDNSEALLILAYDRSSGVLRPAMGKAIFFNREGKFSFIGERDLNTNDGSFLMVDGLLGKILSPIRS
jgi:hypothetical protein